MFERFYTTKMSLDKKKLAKRFSKISSSSGKRSKMICILIFVLLIVAAGVISLVLATKSSENHTMPDEKLQAFVTKPVGAVMAQLDYVDDDKLVFHYLDGFFVYDMKAESLKYAIDLEKLNISFAMQGSEVLEVVMSSDGKEAYLSTIGMKDSDGKYDRYTIDTENGIVSKETRPEDAELFAGYIDLVGGNAGVEGFHCDRGVLSDGKVYALTVRQNVIGSLELVVMDENFENTDYSYVFSKNTEKVDDENDIKHYTLTVEPSELYVLTEEYLAEEFEKTFSPYYDIQSLTISNWKESEDGKKAEFLYTMEYLNYNRDPDIVDYIIRAKENSSEEHYKALYDDYLALKTGNNEFKVVRNGDSLDLYSNVSPVGVELVPVKVSDYILPQEE